MRSPECGTIGFKRSFKTRIYPDEEYMRGLMILWIQVLPELRAVNLHTRSKYQIARNFADTVGGAVSDGENFSPRNGRKRRWN